MCVICKRVLQVINPAPLNSTNTVANTAYSGPAYWAGNGGQVFFRGRRTSRTGATLFRSLSQTLDQSSRSTVYYLHSASLLYYVPSPPRRQAVQAIPSICPRQIHRVYACHASGSGRANTHSG